MRKEILNGNVLINISKLSADGLLHTMLPEIEVMRNYEQRKDKHPGLGYLMIIHHADCYTSPRPCNNNLIIDWMSANNVSNDSLEIYTSWRNSRCIL